MSLEKESRAVDSLTRLLKLAEECRRLFDDAGMEYPAPLRRMLGIVSVEPAGPTIALRVRIEPPSTPHRPQGVSAEWIYVPLDALNLQTFVLGLLRESERTLTLREIVLGAQQRGVEVNEGSLANLGTRLETQGTISRTRGDGWELRDQSRAPILNGEYAWGSRETFTVHELAARRRRIILHVLQHFPEGLQNLQILARLEDLPWLQAPISKDLLKVDMEELQKAGQVRRVGNSKKWTLTRGEAQ